MTRTVEEARAGGLGVVCPKCGGETKVYNSRPDKLAEIRTTTRRRRCFDCGHRFPTHELPASVIEALEARLATLENLHRLIKAL